MGAYDDIIAMKRPTSLKHPPMPAAERAKQFLPFAVLKGYGEAIEQKGVVTDNWAELGEEQREQLNEQLATLARLLSAGSRPLVSIGYFEAEEKRDDTGEIRGHYRIVEGTAEKLSEIERRLRVDGVWYALDDLTMLELAEETADET